MDFIGEARRSWKRLRRPLPVPVPLGVDGCGCRNAAILDGVRDSRAGCDGVAATADVVGWVVLVMEFLRGERESRGAWGAVVGCASDGLATEALRGERRSSGAGGGPAFA